jgi:hypothetical protein
MVAYSIQRGQYVNAGKCHILELRRHEPALRGKLAETYSQATPTGGLGGAQFAPTTGADYASDTSSTYHQDCAIYGFGDGGSDPVLSFTAGASTATLLNFERISGSTDSPDEYRAIDNILVTGQQASSTPEPGTSLLVLAGACAIVTVKRRTVRGDNITSRG